MSRVISRLSVCLSTVDNDDDDGGKRLLSEACAGSECLGVRRITCRVSISSTGGKLVVRALG